MRHVASLVPVLVFLALGCSPRDTAKMPDPLARNVELGGEVMSSLDVEIRFDPNGANCVSVAGGLPDPEDPGDICPDGPGSFQDPLPFQSSRPVRVLADVIAIGSRGTRPFPVTGNVGLASNVATIFSGSPVYLRDGVARDQAIRFMDGPGKVQVWAEASTALKLGGEPISPSFSMGTSESVWLQQPTLQDIQRTKNDAISPLDGKRVDIRGEMLVVTRLAGNGFTVQDMAARPGRDGKPWSGIFVFAFNGAEGIMAGSRLLKLKGAITEFQGMTQVAEPEYVVAGGSCAPPAPAARYGVEETESDEGGGARRARCPSHAECKQVDGADRCVPKGDPEAWEYDRYGRLVCHAVTACGAASSECPSGMHCVDRADWNTVDAHGVSSFTCQVCPTDKAVADIWTTSCGPIYRGDENIQKKLNNEAFEGMLIRLSNLTVSGLDMGNDFYRSGYESFGQWKVMASDGTCATVTSEVAPDFNALEAQNNRLRLTSVTGSLRQVRFKSGSAFWMIDLRHREDLVVAP